jgi:hypothetical protein
MFNALSGLVMVGVGSGGFWYFMPKNGVVHPLAKKPFFDSMITIAIMTVLAIGVALIGDALLG